MLRVSRGTAYLTLAAGLVCAAATLARAGSDGMGMAVPGGHHNFSTEGFDKPQEICVVCHTPHGANMDPRVAGSAPLWNHAITQATFSIYSSPTFANRGGLTITQPDGVSLLCLSCHDGTVGEDQFKPPWGWENPNVSRDDWTLAKFTNPTSISGSFSKGQGGLTIGTDLRNDHPISFVYDQNLAALDPEIFVPDGGLNYITSPNGFQLPLYNGKIQCATCHSVHNKGDQAGAYLLRVGNSNLMGARASGLCLTCHNK